MTLRRRLQENRPIGFRELLWELVRAFGRRTTVGREVPSATPPLTSLRRVSLADDVSRTLFAEYAAHRKSERGTEETGWVLLGIRRGDEAVVLATLPAGAGREAGEAHVQFNQRGPGVCQPGGPARASAVDAARGRPHASRAACGTRVRGIIAATSSGWRTCGAAKGSSVSARPTPRRARDAGIGWQPAPNVQCLGELCLSWYVLGKKDRNYRPLCRLS